MSENLKKLRKEEKAVKKKDVERWLKIEKPYPFPHIPTAKEKVYEALEEAKRKEVEAKERLRLYKEHTVSSLKREMLALLSSVMRKFEDAESEQRQLITMFKTIDTMKESNENKFAVEDLEYIIRQERGLKERIEKLHYDLTRL